MGGLTIPQEFASERGGKSHLLVELRHLRQQPDCEEDMDGNRKRERLLGGIVYTEFADLPGGHELHV